MRENNWKNKGKKLLATVMLACLLLAVTGESSSAVMPCEVIGEYVESRL